MAFNYNKLQSKHITQYREGVDVLLNMLGSPDALVTDLSRLSDWESGEDVLEALSLRDSFDSDSLIWKIAQGITDDNV